MAAKEIVMAKSARMMLHAPQSFVYGSASELESRAKSLRKISERWFSILKVRTELPDEIISSWLDGADVYLTGEQCLAYGLCDRVESPPVPAVAAVPIPVAPLETVSPVPLPYTETEEFLLNTVLPCLPMVTRDKGRLAGEISLWLKQVKEI